MAKIYNVPSQVKVPEFSFTDVKQYEKDCQKFKDDLKAFLLNRKKGSMVGEVIRFPVADGYAEYMVAGLKPVELIHLPLWDAWEFQYANRLTATDIKERVESERILAQLFGPKNKEV